MSSSLLKEWENQGQYLQIQGRKLFVMDKGPRNGPTLVLLHGFPTSSHDFEPVFKFLTEDYRVIVHDHLGFGLSEKPEDYSYSLFEQADMAEMLWKHLGVTSAHIIAHDYGTSIATELIARHVRDLLHLDPLSLNLSNGSMYIHLAQLTISQKLGRMSGLSNLLVRFYSAKMFNMQMQSIFGNSEAVSDQQLEAMWQAVSRDNGIRKIPKIQQYLHERRRFFDRWIGSLRLYDRPSQVLWGALDPVAVPAIAEAVASDLPRCKLRWMKNLGHYPMLEGPEQYAQGILSFLHENFA